MLIPPIQTARPTNKGSSTTLLSQEKLPPRQMLEAAMKRFRVVIVGGGPVGLCLAHSLTLAGIDYVLLESRDVIVEKSGFGLALWPHSVRILDQIGSLMKPVRSICQ